MSYRIVTNSREFEALRDRWNAVHHSQQRVSPYQAWEWNYTWWQNFGEEGRLRLIVVQNEDEIIGIAPFYLEKSFYGVPIAHLRFIGQKRTDYLDFIISGGKQEQFFQQLGEALTELSDEWKFVELKDVPEHSENLAWIYRTLGAEFSHFAVDSSRVCVTVPLTSDWDAFLQTLGKRTRRDVRYDRRYLQKRHQVEFKVFTNSSAVFQGFDDLVKVYQSRWEEEHGAGRLADQQVLRFENEICEQFSGRGDFRLYMLYADEQPVAGLSGYVANQKYYGDIYAHAPKFHKFSVGNVLLGMAIEDSIGLGLKELDLSRGDEAYKFRWNGQAKRNYHLKIFRNRLVSAQVAFVEGLYEKATTSKRLNQWQAQYRKWRYGQ